jgi:hypothetical protein
MQLVSKHFHELASAVLYRTLVFSLTQPESPLYYRDPAFRLADALHMIITSEYDYAKHIKAFILRMSESDPDAVHKRIAAKYHCQEEAGMLLNTSVLVMIRKAQALELFRYVIIIKVFRKHV